MPFFASCCSGAESGAAGADQSDDAHSRYAPKRCEEANHDGTQNDDQETRSTTADDPKVRAVGVDEGTGAKRSS